MPSRKKIRPRENGRSLHLEKSLHRLSSYRTNDNGCVVNYQKSSSVGHQYWNYRLRQDHVDDQNESVITMSGWEKLVSFNRVLYLPKVAHSSLLVSSLRHDDHTDKFTKKKFILKRNESVGGADERGRGMYCVNLRQASN